jgi:hypothetical protein
MYHTNLVGLRREARGEMEINYGKEDGEIKFRVLLRARRKTLRARTLLVLGGLIGNPLTQILSGGPKLTLT